MSAWETFITTFGFKAAVDGDAEDSICTKVVITLYSVVLTLGALAVFIISFFLIYYGSDDCDSREDLNLWSILAGSFGIALPVITAIKRTQFPDLDSSSYQCCKFMLSVFYLAWLLYGIDIVYTCDEACQDGCSSDLFINSIIFLTLNLVLVAMPILLALSHCFCSSCLSALWDTLDSPIGSELDPDYTPKRLAGVEVHHTPFVLEQYPSMHMASV
eukprot:m.25267 g.25267  ORF g.25267 m.25267 type:complete len:216 (-) comp11579_c0_seq1:51-698(-)